MCGPHRRFAPLQSSTQRRIPQALSTVATDEIEQVIPAVKGEEFQYRKR